MNLKLKFSIPKTLSTKALIGILSWVVIIILIFEGVTLKKAFDRITDANSLVPPIKESQVVRINFQAYEQAIKKINNPNPPPEIPKDANNPFAGNKQ